MLYDTPITDDEWVETKINNNYRMNIAIILSGGVGSRMGLNHPATFVPRSIYDRIGIFDERFKLYADADFIIRCYEAGVGVHFIHKVLSNMADGGASNVRSRRELDDSLLKYKKHCKTKSKYLKYATKARIMCFLRHFVSEWYVRWYRQQHNKKRF